MITIKASWLKFVQLVMAIILTFGTANAQLHANFTATPVSGCSPLIVSFTDASTGNPTEWKWDLGNGTQSVLQHPSVSYVSSGTYAVKLVIKNATKADSIVKTQFITVYDNPVVNFNVTPTSGCYPLHVQFTDLSIAAGDAINQWQWDFGDGHVSTQQAPNYTYTTQGIFDVALKVTNVHGCFKVMTKPALVNVSGGVHADFSYVSSGNCQPPTPVAFTNTSTGTGALTYQWFFGDGSTSSDANPTHSYTDAGSYTIKLVTTNSNGCTDTIIKYNALSIGNVKANFAADATGCAGAPITISNTSTPATAAALWSFSDGTSSTDINPVKTFNTAGTYQIKLVNNFGACKDSVTKSITILAKLVVAFTATNNMACAVPATVQFTNTTMGGANYFWNFGDGNTSTLQSPTHLFNQLGNYTVSLVVTNANGCKDSISKKDFVQASAPHINEITVAVKEGCVPLSTSFTADITSVQNIAHYEWDFGDGNNSSLAAPSHVYTSEGTFTVKLIITTTGGCTDTYTLVNAVKVGHKPHAAFSASPKDACAYNGISFADESTNGPIDRWLWNFGDYQTSTAEDPFHRYLDTGYFSIKLIVWNNGCSDTLLKPNYVHINPPVAKFDIALSDCSNKLTASFIDKSIGAITYNWDFGDGTFSGATNPTHTYATPGFYTVNLTVTNGSCFYVKTKSLTIDDRKGKLSLSSVVACRNEAVTFKVDSLDYNDVTKYEWNIGVGNNFITTDPVMGWRYNQAGTYPVSVMVTRANGCKDTLYGNTYVTIYGATAKFAAQNNYYCSGTSVNFLDSSVTDGVHAISNYTWDYGDGNIVNYTNGPFTHQYNTGGNMMVTLKITDTYGCVDSLVKQNAVTVSKSIAAFAESDTTICPGSDVIFTSQSTGNNLAYQWSFGDGSQSAIANPIHAYTNEGTYTVKLLVNDPFGCNDSLVKVNRIRVYRPVAAFTMSDSTAVCPPLLVNMANSSTNVANHLWSFGDGSSANFESPSHLYTYPGLYIVKLVVTNHGGCADSATRKVSILGPTGVFSYSPLVGCIPLQVNFSSVTQNAVKLTWDYNNGVTEATTGNNASFAYTIAGDYIPKLILEDAQGCRVPIIGKDTISAKSIIAKIGVSNAVVCDSGYVNFQHASITNDVVTGYVWKFGDGTISTQPQPSHEYTSNGFYNVKLVVKTQAGCKDSVTVNQLIKVVSTPHVTIVGDNSICRGGSLLFSSTVNNPDTSALTWHWNFGNGNTSTLQNPPVQAYTQAGGFNLVNIITNSSGCADTTTKLISVHDLPVINAGVDTTICRNQSYTLHATGAVSYTWATQSTLSCLNCANPIAKPLTSVMYSVTGTNAFNCVGTDTVFVRVQQHLKLAVSKDDTLCLGQKTILKASGTEKYNWSPSLYIDNVNAAQVNAYPAKDTLMVYRVLGSDEKGCFTDTAYVKLKTYPMPKFEIKQDEIILNAGSNSKIETASSADVSQWKWYPTKWLDNGTIAHPTALAKESLTYTCIASNDGKCVAKDEVKITVLCNNANVFVPNTFSPNNDGANDIFYPRGKGVFTIKSFRIFNRWGEVVFERVGFQANDATAGWDGSFKGAKLPSDVYVYSVEVQCDNSTVIPIKGNVTLLR